MKKNKESIEYRSGWKRVIREGLDVNMPNPSKMESKIQSALNTCSNKNLPKNNMVNTKNTDVEKILSELKDYKDEINKKLDDISDELDTLISIILEASIQESNKEIKGLKKLLRNLGIK